MKPQRIVSVLAIAAAIGGIVLFVSGCADKNANPPVANRGDQNASTESNPVTPPVEAESPTAGNTEEHPHKPGDHGGFIVPIGRDSYHAEAIFEKDGALSLYMLGADESQVIDVENQTLAAFVKVAGSTETTPIELKPAPQEGDAEGRTSRFSGTLPQPMWGTPVEVTIPSIRIGSDRFRLGFSSVVESHEAGIMPDKVTSKEEQELYLTPGGAYTQADIEANGNVTASQKFAGFMSAHDMKPKPGDRICPVTMTKANPNVSWIIGGKNYEFCCPPCVDEFVKMAKTDPDSLKAPEDYVKQ